MFGHNLYLSHRSSPFDSDGRATVSTVGPNQIMFSSLLESPPPALPASAPPLTVSRR